MQDRPTPGDTGDPAPEAGLAASLSSLREAIAGLLEGTLHLVALEARMAAVSLSEMLALGVAGGVLLVTACLALMGALAVWLAGQGLAWEAALAGVAALNGLLAVPVFWAIRRLSRALQFNATRRHLAGARSGAGSGDAAGAGPVGRD